MEEMLDLEFHGGQSWYVLPAPLKGLLGELAADCLRCATQWLKFDLHLLFRGRYAPWRGTRRKVFKPNVGDVAFIHIYLRC